MPGLASLSRSLFAQVNERRSQVILIELDSQNDVPTGQYLPFQYFPETLNDSKAVNWQAKEIPGGSLPLYQWVASGERLITFTATFTTDVDLDSRPGLAQRLAAVGQGRRNIDIRSALVWLRRFMLPSYGQQNTVGTPTTFAPRKAILLVPGSGIGLAGGDLGVEGTDDSITCVMTQCDVVWEALFSNGLPRIVNVSLGFAQVPQRGGDVRFPSVTARMDEAVGSSGPYHGYNIVADIRPPPGGF